MFPLWNNSLHIRYIHLISIHYFQTFTLKPRHTNKKKFQYYLNVSLLIWCLLFLLCEFHHSRGSMKCIVIKGVKEFASSFDKISYYCISNLPFSHNCPSFTHMTCWRHYSMTETAEVESLVNQPSSTTFRCYDNSIMVVTCSNREKMFWIYRWPFRNLKSFSKIDLFFKEYRKFLKQNKTVVFCKLFEEA